MFAQLLAAIRQPLAIGEAGDEVARRDMGCAMLGVGALFLLVLEIGERRQPTRISATLRVSMTIVNRTPSPSVDPASSIARLKKAVPLTISISTAATRMTVTSPSGRSRLRLTGRRSSGADGVRTSHFT